MSGEYRYFISDDNLKIRYLYRFSKKGAKGVVLLLNGRAECMEKYREVAAALERRDFDVASLDWRGQGLSERELSNRHKGYVKDFQWYVRDLERLYHEVMTGRNLPVIVLGHSMGAHVALRFIRENPKAVACALLVSPMIDIRIRALPSVLVRIMARTACRLGFSNHYVIGGRNFSPARFKFEKNVLTHDPEGFGVQLDEIGKEPRLAVGDVTWAWLDAAFRSIDTLSEKEYAQGVPVPVLLVSADEDRVVDQQAQKNICRIIPRCTFVNLPGAFHEILFETKEIRERFWEYFDAFVSGC